jgi:hypothetical protein
LADRSDIETEEQIAHRGITRNGVFINRRRRDGQTIDYAGQVSEQRALEQTAGVIGVVLDARHHIGAGEALRILE